MKVLIRAAVYGRKDTVKIFYDGLDRIVSSFRDRGIESNVLIVCSTDDEYQTAKDRGYNVLKYPNKPIGKKLNFAMRYALDNFDWDYFIEMGSDNLITPAGVALIESLMLQEIKSFASTSLIIIDKATLRSKWYDGGVVFGAGRCIQRKLIENTFSRIGKVWEDKLNRGLDTCSNRNIEIATGVKCMGVRLPKPTIIDIKTEDNINKFDSFPANEVDYFRWCEELAELEKV